MKGTHGRALYNKTIIMTIPTMKILYGITKSNFGGAQRYVFDLATTMQKQGHDVAVMCGGDGPLIQKLEAGKIRVIKLDKMQRDISLEKEIVSFFQMLKILRSERPDVFHINSSKMGGLGGLGGRLLGIRRIIFTSHGWAFNESRLAWQKLIIKLLVWLTIILSHKTICVSKKTKKDVKRWPFIKNKLVVIYNGISSFSLAGRTDKTFTIGTIAELHKIKGLDILLAAWDKFVKNHQAKLVIIGEGEERQNLEIMAKNMGISDSVTFKGAADNARSLLSNFDIFCMPSRSEALHYTLLEAGFAKLPVIATPVGGIPEIIESGINGILIPVENAEVLFSSLVLFHDNPRMRDRLGTTLKETIIKNFSFEQMVENTLNIYL